jgi:hypothetical protein
VPPASWHGPRWGRSHTAAHSSEEASSGAKKCPASENDGHI